MRPTFNHSIAVRIAKFAIPVAIIGYLLWRIEPAQWHELGAQEKNYGLLAAALLVALVALSLSFARWCILVRCQGIELTMLEAFRLGAISFLLSFVSAGSVGGDLFKAIFLARRRPGKRVAAVASVLVDRACGLYALILLVAVGLLLADPVDRSDGAVGLGQIKLATATLFVAGTSVLAILVLGGKQVDRWITALGDSGLVGRVLSRTAPPLRMFHAHTFALAAAIVMSVGVQGLLAVSVYLIATGLYDSPPTLLEHVVIVPIGMLASALPITPAGIGVFEVAIESLYQVVPSVETDASGTLVALVFEIVKVVMAVIGTVFYWTANTEVRESLEAAELEAADGGQEPTPDLKRSPVFDQA
jgi:uncharacterized protein (TIRG00374 family)